MMKLFLLQVEVNILTGETKILQSDIIYDSGQSMNPAVDLGQVSDLFHHTCQILQKVSISMFNFIANSK